MYYRNAAAAVVVYDVTSAVSQGYPLPCVRTVDSIELISIRATFFLQTSLEKAKSWVKELQRQANPNIVIAFSQCPSPGTVESVGRSYLLLF